jgi:DNA-binding NtrC family response regulator
MAAADCEGKVWREVWVSGPQPFVTRIQDLTAARYLSHQSKPNRGDLVLVDLDEAGEYSPHAAIEVACEAECHIVVVCAPRLISKAVLAVQRGAHEVVTKPLRATDLAHYVPVDATEAELDVESWRKDHAAEIIGESPALQEALALAMQASAFDCPVLITGESGTGKELLARAIHRGSTRGKNAFVPVNCPAIPRELIESELFGHSKGAFTGATAQRAGCFEVADRGSIMLDEIGEMDLEVQVKLLRVLQDYHITPVGESRPKRVDVRVIAATNRDLEQMAGAGRFRSDLYYRLNVVHIHLPPLRERPGDTEDLIDHLTQTLALERSVPAPVLTPEAHAALVEHEWPGNIRQLRNVIDRLVMLRRGRIIDLSHLPSVISGRATERQLPAVSATELPVGGIDLRDTMAQFEERMIEKALTIAGGNKNQAARILGLKRTTLVEKLRKRSAPAPS